MSATLTEQQLKDLTKNLMSFLSLYKHISDSYIIEFFSENLWQTLPIGWQNALGDLTPPQIADLLLDKDINDRTYPSVWPLALLAFRASAHALAFPRTPTGGQDAASGRPEEFQANHSQSSLLGHIFRKHVKPKKQHEIRRLGMLVKRLCDTTCCNSVVDVGSGQGHLTRFMSYGLGLSVTGIEADPKLVCMASKFDGQLLSTLEKESQRAPHLIQSLPGPSPCHVVGWVNPKATWEVFIQQVMKERSESDGDEATGGPCKKRQWISMTDPDLETRSGNTAQANCPSCAVSDKTVLLHQMPDAPSEGTAEVCSLPSALKHQYKCDSNTLDLSHEKCPHSGDSRSPLMDIGLGYGTQRYRGPNFVLTGLHACGDLSATLLRHLVNCPHVQGITSVACCYMKLTTEENPSPPGISMPPASNHTDGPSHSEFGYPMSEWARGLPGHHLSYKAREGACHAMEDYVVRLREESDLLRTHCYRAMLETVIRAQQPDLRRAGIQTIKRAHTLTFSEYARLGLPRVGLPAALPLDRARVESMLAQQGRVVVYFSLALLLAPVVETLVLLDRMLFLQEKGLQCQLLPLFDPALSPRNLVLVAMKPRPEAETRTT